MPASTLNIYVFRGLPKYFWQSGAETAKDPCISRSFAGLAEPRNADPRTALAQFWAPPKPLMAWVMPLGLSMIWEKRTTVTVSSTETVRS